MVTTHELYDHETANAVAGFESEAAALAAVREMLREDGRDLTTGLVLFAVDAHGGRTLVAGGDGLIDRAKDAAAIAGTSA